MSEIVRAGFKAVDEGQIEAAQALGMTRLQTMWRITLPQAMRVIIPPTGNELISMLKTSSLASAIAVTELLKSTSNIASRTFQTMQLLIVASLWYLTVTTVLSIGQFYVERHFAKGSSRSTPRRATTSWRSWKNVMAADRPSSPASSPSRTGTRSSQIRPTPTPSSTGSSTTPTASTCPVTVCGGHARNQPREVDRTMRSVPRITCQRGSADWAASGRNPGRNHIGMPGRLRRNQHLRRRRSP